jgi:hypothetical protein
MTTIIDWYDIQVNGDAGLRRAIEKLAREQTALSGQHEMLAYRFGQGMGKLDALQAEVSALTERVAQLEDLWSNEETHDS